MMNSSNMRVALYARVSSEQQAEAGTIASQIEALHERIRVDGLSVDKELEYIDDGYSGATLIRPALERLRDTAASGCIDRLYVHSPDRLARKYAYQVLLVDEMRQCGVQIEFLNHGVGDSPEESLLLQVQGMVAEYERAKILERSRRGKLHAARCGSVTVVATAPYGYRYIPAGRHGGQACYEVVWEQAKVVRQVFEWIGKERRSISWVVKRLSEQKIATKTGKSRWERSTVWGMLKNPAYKGAAAFGRRRVGERRPRLRPSRGNPEQPKQATSRYAVAPEQWISIPVPAIVSEDLFATVQEQLQENRRRARERAGRVRYLLQGLVVCAQCGYAYHGMSLGGSAAAKGRAGKRVYYRCSGTDSYRFGGQRVCANKSVRSELLETAVWADVCSVLSDPQRIEQEWQRRLAGEPADDWDTSRQVRVVLEKVKRGISRLIDSYQEGLIEKAEFEPRMRSAKQRLQRLESELKQRQNVEENEAALRLVVGRMRDFADKVTDSLEHADWSTQCDIIRAVVKRVEIDEEEVRVVYKIAPTATQTPQNERLQSCLDHPYGSAV